MYRKNQSFDSLEMVVMTLITFCSIKSSKDSKYILFAILRKVKVPSASFKSFNISKYFQKVWSKFVKMPRFT